MKKQLDFSRLSNPMYSLVQKQETAQTERLPLTELPTRNYEGTFGPETKKHEVNLESIKQKLLLMKQFQSFQRDSSPVQKDHLGLSEEELKFLTKTLQTKTKSKLVSKSARPTTPTPISQSNPQEESLKKLPAKTTSRSTVALIEKPALKVRKQQVSLSTVRAKKSLSVASRGNSVTKEGSTKKTQALKIKKAKPLDAKQTIVNDGATSHRSMVSLRQAPRGNSQKKQLKPKSPPPKKAVQPAAK